MSRLPLRPTLRCALHGTSAAYWMNMQARYNLERAEDELDKELRKIPSVRDVKSAA